jgi:hypothetical protein
MLRHGDDFRQGAIKNAEFAKLQGAEKFLPRRICSDMQARKFFRNAAVWMKSGFLT